jgi:hypothetical protein
VKRVSHRQATAKPARGHAPKAAVTHHTKHTKHTKHGHTPKRAG